jgi:O-antigen ligase
MIVLIFGVGRYRKILLISLVFISSIAIGFSSKFSIFQREAFDESYNFRMAIWSSAYDIFKDHPILGIGIGNYANYVAINKPDQFWIAENEIVIYDHPESGYLKLLIEFGLIGFCAFLLIILFPIIKGFFKYLKSRNMVILFFICSLISWMVGFYSVYSLGDIRVSLLITLIICMLISEIKYDYKKISK